MPTYESYQYKGEFLTLGLLIAREFVYLNEGFIRIESVPKQGARVMVGLPLA